MVYIPKNKTVSSHIFETECPICGKRFVPAPFHRYKLLIGTKEKLVCTYSCMSRGLREKEEAHRERIAAATARRRAARIIKNKE